MGSFSDGRQSPVRRQHSDANIFSHSKSPNGPSPVKLRQVSGSDSKIRTMSSGSPSASRLNGSARRTGARTPPHDPVSPSGSASRLSPRLGPRGRGSNRTTPTFLDSSFTGKASAVSPVMDKRLVAAHMNGHGNGHGNGAAPLVRSSSGDGMNGVSEGKGLTQGSSGAPRQAFAAGKRRTRQVDQRQWMNSRQGHVSVLSRQDMSNVKESVSQLQHMRSIAEAKEFLDRKLKVVDSLAAVIGVVSVLLSAAENEYFYQNDSVSDSTCHLLRSFISILCAALCACVWVRHRYILRLSVVTDRLFGSESEFVGVIGGSQLFWMLLELSTCAVHCPPGVDATVSYNSLGETKVYTLDSLASVAMLLRLYLPVRCITHYAEFTNARAKRVGRMNYFESDLAFALKATMKTHPFMLLASGFVFSTIVFGYALRVFEMPVNAVQDTLELRYFANAMWNIIVTMTTVGYGDIYPVTNPGRFVATMACLVGVFLVGLMVVTLQQTFEFNNFEDRGFSMLTKLKLNDLRRIKAAQVLQAAWRLSAIRKRGGRFKQKYFAIMLVAMRNRIRDFHTTNRQLKAMQINADMSDMSFIRQFKNEVIERIDALENRQKVAVFEMRTNMKELVGGSWKEVVIQREENPGKSYDCVGDSIPVTASLQRAIHQSTVRASQPQGYPMREWDERAAAAADSYVYTEYSSGTDHGGPVGVARDPFAVDVDASAEGQIVQEFPLSLPHAHTDALSPTTANSDDSFAAQASAAFGRIFSFSKKEAGDAQSTTHLPQNQNPLIRGSGDGVSTDPRQRSQSLGQIGMEGVRLDDLDGPMPPYPHATSQPPHSPNPPHTYPHSPGYALPSHARNQAPHYPVHGQSVSYAPQESHPSHMVSQPPSRFAPPLQGQQQQQQFPATTSGSASNAPKEFEEFYSNVPSADPSDNAKNVATVTDLKNKHVAAPDPYKNPNLKTPAGKKLTQTEHLENIQMLVQEHKQQQDVVRRLVESYDVVVEDVQKRYFNALFLLHRTSRSSDNCAVDPDQLYERAQRDRIPYTRWSKWLMEQDFGAS